MTDRETMIHVYEAEIEVLQNENNQLKAQVAFLKEQLAYKTFGKPTHEDDK
jgi:cell division septum initiation protein DivIVA